MLTFSITPGPPSQSAAGKLDAAGEIKTTDQDARLAREGIGGRHAEARGPRCARPARRRGPATGAASADPVVHLSSPRVAKMRPPSSSAVRLVGSSRPGLPSRAEPTPNTRRSDLPSGPGPGEAHAQAAAVGARASPLHSSSARLPVHVHDSTRHRIRARKYPLPSARQPPRPGVPGRILGRVRCGVRPWVAGCCGIWMMGWGGAAWAVFASNRRTPTVRPRLPSTRFIRHSLPRPKYPVHVTVTQSRPIRPCHGYNSCRGSPMDNGGLKPESNAVPQ